MKHNQEFIRVNGAHLDASLQLIYDLFTFLISRFFFQSKQIQAFFLNPYEESLLLRQYELQLKEFCKRFEPPMPIYAIGTAFQYFKRFYLNNSPMDYHPKEILYEFELVTSSVLS